MLMMNTNGISTVQFQSLDKKLVKSKRTNLRTDRIGVIRTGRLSQNQREEIITTPVNHLLAAHALGMVEGALVMMVDDQEIIEDVPETNETIVD